MKLGKKVEPFIKKHKKISAFVVGKPCPRCKDTLMNIYGIGYSECPKCHYKRYKKHKKKK